MATKKNVKPSIDYQKLKLLVTIVDKSKALFYVDVLEQYEVNMQLVLSGHGTADSKTLELFGLVESDKAVILSVIKEDNTKKILQNLKEKFAKVRNGKGIAYTIPLKSIIGVSVYQFLSNNRMGVNK